MSSVLVLSGIFSNCVWASQDQIDEWFLASRACLQIHGSDFAMVTQENPDYTDIHGPIEHGLRGNFFVEDTNVLLFQEIDEQLNIVEGFFEPSSGTLDVRIRVKVDSFGAMDHSELGLGVFTLQKRVCEGDLAKWTRSVWKNNKRRKVTLNECGDPIENWREIDWATRTEVECNPPNRESYFLEYYPNGLPARKRHP